MTEDGVNQLPVIAAANGELGGVLAYDNVPTSVRTLAEVGEGISWFDRASRFHKAQKFRAQATRAGACLTQYVGRRAESEHNEGHRWRH